jgi:hypothetical protein
MDSHEGKLLSVPQLPITASSSAETLTGILFPQREKTREINGNPPSLPPPPSPTTSVVDRKPELLNTDPVTWVINY